MEMRFPPLTSGDENKRRGGRGEHTYLWSWTEHSFSSWVSWSILFLCSSLFFFFFFRLTCSLHLLLKPHHARCIYQPDKCNKSSDIKVTFTAVQQLNASIVTAARHYVTNKGDTKLHLPNTLQSITDCNTVVPLLSFCFLFFCFFSISVGSIKLLSSFLWPSTLIRIFCDWHWAVWQEALSEAIC